MREGSLTGRRRDDPADLVGVGPEPHRLGRRVEVHVADIAADRVHREELFGLRVEADEAVRLAAPTYIVSFMFVYESALITIGDPGLVLWRALASCIGVMCFAAALQGWLLRSASLWQRAALLAAVLFGIYYANWAYGWITPDDLDFYN